MAYITESNLKKLLIDIDKRKLSYDLPITLDVAITRILSQPELQWIEGFRLLCLDPSFIFDEKFQRIDPKKDTKTWASERDNEQPAYHFNPMCERLNSDYINFKIPAEIKARGDKEIKRFREWFKENRSLLVENEGSFIIHLQIAFSLKNPPQKGSIIKENSGIMRFTNEDLSELKNKMNHILHESETFRNSSPEIMKEIRCWGYATHKHPDVKNKNSIIYKWHNYKNSLKSLLITYFRVKFNPELEFEGLLLEQLGFRACQHCKQSDK